MQATAIKFGWKAGTEQYPPYELLQSAIAAEEAGFDSIDVSDHFHPWSERGQACFAWTWLGAAAAKTQHVMLGTGVTCPILRYHPAIIAQASATLACLSPGRVFLGIGAGEALNEFSVTGQWPEFAARQSRVKEAVELIRALWTGEKVTWRGVHYQTRRANLYTLCEHPIPLLISALVPNSARFAGKCGDGLITVGGKEPELYREILRNFAEGAREAGKDPENMTRMIELGVDFTADSEQAIAVRKAYWAGVFVPALFTEKL